MKWPGIVAHAAQFEKREILNDWKIFRKTNILGTYLVKSYITDLGTLSETLIETKESHLGCPGLY